MRITLQAFKTQRQSGMSLSETIISMALTLITVAGTIDGYIISTQRAEWSAQSLAAHSMALQRLEQIRAAKWDLAGYPAIDQVIQANFPAITNLMDLPVSGTNAETATIYTTITTVSANPPLKMVKVDCVWPFINRGMFTNTVISYRAPGQQ